jgi:hypothetical protein
VAPVSLGDGMSLIRSRPPAAAVDCPRCGASFRARLTRGRCPICDWAAAEEGGASGVGARLLGDRWPVALLALTVAGNLAILIVVAVKVSGR